MALNWDTLLIDDEEDEENEEKQRRTSIDWDNLNLDYSSSKTSKTNIDWDNLFLKKKSSQDNTTTKEDTSTADSTLVSHDYNIRSDYNDTQNDIQEEQEENNTSPDVVYTQKGEISSTKRYGTTSHLKRVTASGNSTDNGAAALNYVNKNSATFKDDEASTDSSNGSNTKLYYQTQKNFTNSNNTTSENQYNDYEAGIFVNPSTGKIQEPVTNKQGVTIKETATTKAQNRAGELNEMINNGGSDKVKAILENELDSVMGGIVSTAAGIANVISTVKAFGLNVVKNIKLMFNDETGAEKLQAEYNNTVETGKRINETGEHDSNVTARIENDNIKLLGSATHTVSQVATNSLFAYSLGASGIPIGGSALQGISVGGTAAQEVLNENKDNINQAVLTGLTKGLISKLTEDMFDANILTKGQGGSISNMVDDLVFKTIKNEFGRNTANIIVGVVGENLEEIAEDNLDNVVDKLINGKDMPDFKEWFENTTETIKVTTLSTIILNLLGLGGSSFNDKIPEIRARQIQKVVDDGGYAIQYDTSVFETKDTVNTFYTTQFNKQGEVTGLTATKGKAIDNPNSKVNVSPAIIQNQNGYYNIIDSNTGVLLDTTPYTTMIAAQSDFSHKMINLDQTSINEINKKVQASNLSIKNKMVEVINEARAELTANDIEMAKSDTQNANTANYMSQDEKSNVSDSDVNTVDNNPKVSRTFINKIEEYKKSSNKLNNVNGNITEINNNIYDGVSKKKQSNLLNEYLKNEVRGHDFYANGKKIIANNTTIGKLKNGHTNYSKNIDSNIRQELKANIITNLDNIINNSYVYQADRPDTKNHSFADTFDRRKSIVSYQNNTYEIMFEIGKKNGISTLYGIEHIKKIGKVTSRISQNGISKTPSRGGKSTVPSNNITQNNKNVNNNSQITDKTGTLSSKIDSKTLKRVQNNATLNMEDRTFENVSNKNVKPYQQEHIEVQEHIQNMAYNFLEDLNNSTKGERYKAGDTWTGTKRSTTKELAYIKDTTNASWDNIEKALNDITDNDGNYALAKKVEIVLDDALSNGYTNVYGKTVMPNNEYLTLKEKIEGKQYIDNTSDDVGYDDIDTDIFSMKKSKHKIRKKENYYHSDDFKSSRC